MEHPAESVMIPTISVNAWEPDHMAVLERMNAVARGPVSFWNSVFRSTQTAPQSDEEAR